MDIQNVMMTQRVNGYNAMVGKVKSVGLNFIGALRDEVVISSNEPQYELYINKAKAMNDVNYQKVNRIKEQIENGGMQLDSGRIARAMLRYKG